MAGLGRWFGEGTIVDMALCPLMDEVDALERSLWLDEAQCQSFLQTLSDTFTLFKQRKPAERY